jgi:hypothetical protein
LNGSRIDPAAGIATNASGSMDSGNSEVTSPDGGSTPLNDKACGAHRGCRYADDRLTVVNVAFPTLRRMFGAGRFGAVLLARS